MQIQVKGRSIVGFPKDIGYQNDNNVEEYEFVLPRFIAGKDLNEGFCSLLFLQADQSTGMVLLDKEVSEEAITAKWIVGSEVTTIPGMLRFELRISGLESMLWHSEITLTNILASIQAESPQVMMLSAGSPSLRMSGNPDHFPENEPPIVIAERKINIPSALRNIAVQNDENSETVKILLPRWFDGIDLSNKSIFLKTVSAGGRDDILLSPVVIESDTIELHWTLKPPQTSYSGKLQLQIYVLGVLGEGVDYKWETDAAEVNIITSLDSESVIPATPTILDEFAKKMSEIAQSVNGAVESASESAKSAADSAKEAQAIKDSTEVLYDVNGDRVGFKRAIEEDYTYTDHLTGPKGDRGEDGVILFPSFEMDFTSGELLLDLPKQLDEVSFEIDESGILQYELKGESI